MVRFTKPSNMTICIEDCAIGDSFVENGLSKKKKVFVVSHGPRRGGCVPFLPHRRTKLFNFILLPGKEKLARRTCSNFLLMDGWMDG